MPPAMHEAFLENYRWLARYNAWFNERLFDACEQLSPQQRRLDRGAFFGSIHDTLSHVLWADKMWLQRFAAQGTPFPALKPELLALPAGAVHATLLHEEWPDLRADRRALDAAIQGWVQGMPAQWPASTMTYTNTQGVARRHPAWQALTHFFNHQAHHRGQVTALLAQAGVDVGMTDAIALADRD
jgi:uncharacterized damage-inducible protein DinB